MILRQVMRLNAGTKVKGLMPDADLPEVLQIIELTPHDIGEMLRVHFWTGKGNKREYWAMYPDDLVEVIN